MKTPCRCCDGIQLISPVAAKNRPGLSGISYRVGSYATILESMLARLSSAAPISAGDDALPANSLSPLTGLRVRQPDDPSIALLDAWAVVADVLTFYQERIANEGYLRTAIERRSVLELARLLGYRPRPGVASSVYMAFTLQSGFDVDIPAGAAAKTSPGPGELPQTFETSAPIYARSAWNELIPRRTRPQRITQQTANEIDVIYFAGASTRLKQNDRLLLVFGDEPGRQFMRRVASVAEDNVNRRTKVGLQVEAFSAAQFSIEMQKIVQDQIKSCKELASVASIKELQAALRMSNPLSKSSAAVRQATDDLASQMGDAEASVKDLTAVHDFAAALSTGLSALLGQPHAALATNVGGAIDRFTAQEVHAANVDSALTKFGDLMRIGGARLAPKVAALVAADATLKAEAESIPEFSTLAVAMQKLRTDWQGASTDIPTKIKDTLEKVASVLTAAVGRDSAPDQGLIDQLKGIQTSLNNVAAAGAGEQMVQLEKAISDLTGATATLPGLKTDLKGINSTLAAIVKPVTDRLDDASSALDDHSELHPSDDVRSNLNKIHDAVQSLKAKLPAAPLLNQRTAINEALSTVKSISTFGQPLLKRRLQELTASLQQVPGKVVQTDLIAALDATPIPAVADAKAQAHATAITGFVQPVRTAADFFDAVANAQAAAGKLDSESGSIQDAIQSAQSERGCFTTAAAALTAEQSRFADHFKKLFQGLSSRYRITLPDGANKPIGVEALTLIDNALKPDALTLVDLANAMDDVQKKVDKKASGLPVTETQLRQWFNELERDVTAQLSAIEENQSQPPVPAQIGKNAFVQLKEIAASLLTPTAAGKPAAPDLKTIFGAGSDAVARSLVVMKPGLGDQLLQGWGNIKVDLPVVEVYAFRARASLFGYNAPKSRITKVTNIDGDANGAGRGQQFAVVEGGDPATAESPQLVSLEAAYDQIVPGSWMAVQSPASQPLFAKAADATSGVGIARYGMTGKTTGISLRSPSDPAKAVNWFDDGKLTFPTVRGTVVWAQAEALDLAEVPLTDETDPVGPVKVPVKTAGDSVELDGYFDGLMAGRFVAVTGERMDVTGVSASEMAQIAAIEQVLDITLPGDTLHTELLFSAGLRHQYKRDTVKINANVAHATHGEIQKEVLGSGDGSSLFQTFKLSKPPLTYLSQPTPSGAESTLQVRVNDILWREADNLAALGRQDRKYIIDIQDDGATRVTFGDGIHGMRLPTGVENVRAVYRSGIGKGGNVIPKKISLLPSPPLGVTLVSNPAAATGGADAETRDQARRNAPVAVLALDRLVSVRDYADFARTYAGIAKANASLDSGAVAVTVAGIDDIPIDPASDLFHNLLASIEEFGDPHQAVKLQVRKLNILVLQAGIAIDPDYNFKVVSGHVRAALLERFGFDRQELGEAASLSQIIGVIQHTPGVLYVEVEHFDAIPEIDEPDPQKITDLIAKLHKPKRAVQTKPNEICYFSPDLSETIVLKQILPRGSA